MPDWSEYLDGVGVGDASGGGGSGDAADTFGDGVRDIRLKKKTRKWHRRLVYAATAKSPGDFLQICQKVNEGNYM